MSNRSLEQVLKEISDSRAIASVDLGSIPVKTRGSLAIAKNDAVNRLVGLEAEYRDCLNSKVAVIFLYGDLKNQKAFAAVAEAEGETLTVDADEMYRVLADAVEPTIGAQRQFGGTQVNHLLRALEDVARQCGAGFLPVPRLTEVVISDLPDSAGARKTVDIVREMIRDQIGDSLNVKYLESRITALALKNKYGEKSVPVVVLNTQLTAIKSDIESAPVRRAIFSGRGIGVNANPPQDQTAKDLVLAAFAKLREYLKKQ